MGGGKNTFLYALLSVSLVFSCKNKGKENQIEMRLEKVEREIATLKKALDENSNFE